MHAGDGAIVQAKAQIAAQIPAGQLLILGPRRAVDVGDFVGVPHALIGRRLQQPDDVGADGTTRPGPERPYERQPRHVRPRGAKVRLVHAFERVSEERRISDEQRCVRDAEHLGEIRRVRHELG